MTAEEANSKWCPMARSGEPQRRGANRWFSDSGVPTLTMCVGSACMMWRWRNDTGEARTEGYCGLAGKP